MSNINHNDVIIAIAKRVKEIKFAPTNGGKNGGGDGGEREYKTETKKREGGQTDIFTAATVH